MKKVLIDNGHGVKTAGKRSPDGRLIEGVYAREIATLLARVLEDKGVSYARITPEGDDVKLNTRVYRANSLHKQSKEGTIFISLHSDAACNTGWHSAKGFSVLVDEHASKATRVFARNLYAAAESEGMPVRKYKGDTQPYWYQNLAVCRKTAMPAVLVEMFFHTNKEQVDWALSEEGKQSLVKALSAGILKTLKQL